MCSPELIIIKNHINKPLNNEPKTNTEDNTKIINYVKIVLIP